MVNFQSSETFFSSSSSLATIDLQWPLDITHVKDYQASIEQYCDARIQEWKNSMISKKLAYLSELEELHHVHILSIQEKKQAKAAEESLIERISEETERKRSMLKQSIEVCVFTFLS